MRRGEGITNCVLEVNFAKINGTENHFSRVPIFQWIFIFQRSSSSPRGSSSNFAVGRLILTADDSNEDAAKGSAVGNGFAGGVNWHFVDFTADAKRQSTKRSEGEDRTPLHREITSALVCEISQLKCSGTIFMLNSEHTFNLM